MRDRIYLEEGPDIFSIERRGKNTGRLPKFSKEVEEKLLSEVQRLHAEVEYLKNYKP